MIGLTFHSKIKLGKILIWNSYTTSAVDGRIEDSEAADITASVWPLQGIEAQLHCSVVTIAVEYSSTGSFITRVLLFQ